MRVLVIEDDPGVARLIKSRLERAGNTVEEAADGRIGLTMAMDRQYDVMVIDRVLPHTEGLEIVERLRDAGNSTPILVLSALGETDDRVRGLRSGSDDYLVKPFASSELVARVEALARRPRMGRDENRLTVGGLMIDQGQQLVFRDGTRIRLNPKEYQLLQYLMRHAGRTVTRRMILEGVWGYHFEPDTNVVDVHIGNLRRKIDENSPEPLIHTIRGVGFVLRQDE